MEGPWEGGAEAEQLGSLMLLPSELALRRAPRRVISADLFLGRATGRLPRHSAPRHAAQFDSFSSIDSQIDERSDRISFDRNTRDSDSRLRSCLL